jgi:cytochrome P450
VDDQSVTHTSRSRAECTVDFDHHGPAFALDPPGELARAHAVCPVTWSDAHGGFWLVTGYEQAYTVLQDDELYSSSDGVSVPQLHRSAPPIDVDPPLHTSYRRALAAPFSPSGVRPLTDLVVDWAREAVDEIAASGRGDLVRDLGAPVPAKAIMTLLGLDLEHWRRYAAVWHDLFAHPQEPAVYEQLGAVRDELLDTMRAKRGCPADDVMSHLWASGLLDEVAAADPLAWPVDHGAEVAMTLLGAGVDTTTNLFVSTAVWLARNPAERARLNADPDLMDTAVEEFLRYFSVAPALARTVRADHDFYGHEFHDGDRVLVAFMAANRDPEVFDRPDEVILDRRPNRHMAFGVGRHRCIGSNLAKLVFPVLIRELLAAFPDYEVAVDQLELYDDRAQVTGWSSVPFTFSARAVQHA